MRFFYVGKRAVFIRIPKTASTSIVKTLSAHRKVLIDNKRDRFLSKSEMPQLGQATRDAIGPRVWNRCYSFTFVRNPYDRCVSTWKYIKSPLSFEAYTEQLRALSLKSINDFSYESWHACLQRPHVVDESGHIIIDFIGRFENLQADFDHLCDHLQIRRQSLPHFKKTEHIHYSAYYTGTARENVEEIYREDIDCFGYTYDESP